MKRDDLSLASPSTLPAERAKKREEKKEKEGKNETKRTVEAVYTSEREEVRMQTFGKGMGASARSSIRSKSTIAELAIAAAAKEN